MISYYHMSMWLVQYYQSCQSTLLWARIHQISVSLEIRGLAMGNEVETRVTVGILVSPTFSPSLSSFIFDDVLVFVFVFFFEVPSFALFKEDFFFVFFSSSNPDFSARGSNILSSFIVFNWILVKDTMMWLQRHRRRSWMFHHTTDQSRRTALVRECSSILNRAFAPAGLVWLVSLVTFSCYQWCEKRESKLLLLLLDTQTHTLPKCSVHANS